MTKIFHGKSGFNASLNENSINNYFSLSKAFNQNLLINNCQMWFWVNLEVANLLTLWRIIIFKVLFKIFIFILKKRN